MGINRPIRPTLEGDVKELGDKQNSCRGRNLDIGKNLLNTGGRPKNKPDGVGGWGGMK